MISIIIGAISLSTVFLFGCLGEIITEKSGNLNLGIPGIMCVGTAGGCFITTIYIGNTENPSYVLVIILGILFSFLFAALVGLIYSFLTITLRCNQNITGLAITTFGAGFTQFFIDNNINYGLHTEEFNNTSKLICKILPFASNLGGVGKIFFNHGFLTYLSVLIAVVIALVIKKTKVGLSLRSVGESPQTADAAGINVNLYKYTATLIGAGIAGIGGFYYIMYYLGGSWENSSTIEALGWLSIALVIFSLWRADVAIFGSFIFALLYIVGFKVVGITFTQKAVLQLLPYIITIIVLIITSVFGKKNVQPPQSLGLNYFREDR